MRTTKKTLVAVLILGLSRSVSAGERAGPEEITLVRGGKPNVTIVVAETPTPSAKLAAVELQYHVKRITGVSLPIKGGNERTAGARILVGESRHTSELGIRGSDFQPQEYLIGFRHDTVVLIGRNWQDTEENRNELGRSTSPHPDPF